MIDDERQQRIMWAERLIKESVGTESGLGRVQYPSLIDHRDGKCEFIFREQHTGRRFPSLSLGKEHLEEASRLCFEERFEDQWKDWKDQLNATLHPQRPAKKRTPTKRRGGKDWAT